MIKKTISILIPALNEEKNILTLLESISAQKLSDDFIVNKIFVISDGSTDKTNEIVSEYEKKHRNVELVINEKRIGKISSVGKGFHLIDSDYLVMFDADIQIKNDTIFELCRVIATKKYDLVAGNPVPNPSRSIFNVAEQASMLSWHLVQAIKKTQPESIYSAHGRILMLSKSLYKNIDVHELSTPGDDQFIYLQCKGSFMYAPNAIVYYRLPGNIGDYLKQNVRFRRAKGVCLQAKFDLEKLFFVKKEVSIVLRLAFGHPIRFLCWGLLYVTGFIKYNLQKFFGKKGDDWGVASSTK